MQTFTNQKLKPLPRYEIIVRTKDNSDFYEAGNITDYYINSDRILILKFTNDTEIQYKKWDSFKATTIKEPRKDQ